MIFVIAHWVFVSIIYNILYLYFTTQITEKYRTAMCYWNIRGILFWIHQVLEVFLLWNIKYHWLCFFWNIKLFDSNIRGILVLKQLHLQQGSSVLWALSCQWLLLTQWMLWPYISIYTIYILPIQFPCSSNYLIR